MLLLSLALLLPPQSEVRVHSVSDLSQEFSFYMDGRFHTQYLKSVGRDVRNWGSLHRLDLANTNLLVLVEGDAHVPYTPASIEHVERFVREGGTVLLMADGADPMPPGALVAERLGAKLTTQQAAKPARAAASGAFEVEYRGGRTLALGSDWTVLVEDAQARAPSRSTRRARTAVRSPSMCASSDRCDSSSPTARSPTPSRSLLSMRWCVRTSSRSPASSRPRA